MSDRDAGSAESTASAAEVRPIDFRSALHPFEQSRLALALGAGSVIVAVPIGLLAAAAGLPGLLGVGFALVVLFGSIWLALQVHRARLLGNAIRVEPGSLPEAHAALVTVRRQLAYHRRVDVYLAAEVPGKATWLSFLGHRVILLEGDFVAELLSSRGQAGLRFVLGSFLGALKARHARVLPLLLLLQFFDAVKFAAPFMLPYHRATRYSGDQLGYLCAGDLTAAMAAVSRLLVGNDAAPGLGVRGVLDQIELVRRGALPRLAQLFADAPHLVNRYLNVLAFAARVAPEEFRAFVEELDEDTRQHLRRLLSGTPHTGPRPQYRPPARPVRPLYASLGIAAVAVLVLVLVLLDPNRDRSASSAPADPGTTTTVVATTTAFPASAYTAMELFGAASDNGTCGTIAPEGSLSGYEIETVECYDYALGYSRYFYKYSGIDPSGWVSLVRDNEVFDTLTFYESGYCYDTYSATYTGGDGVLYNSALFVLKDAPFVALVSGNAALTDLTTMMSSEFYVTENSALC